IFEGNVDNLYQARNTFRPAFNARYVRVVPQQWEQKIGLSAELLGCSYVRDPPVFMVTSPVTREVLSSQPKPDRDEIPEHLPQSDLVKMIVIVVAAVGCVIVLLLSGICAFKVMQK
ncbi:discoidin, CUB and LCCL domain-containing protein 1, partial [Tachysurus ichikawai]